MQHEIMAQLLVRVGEAISHRVHRSLKEQKIGDLSAVYREGAEDTIYQIDKEVEEVVVPLLSEGAGALGGMALMAEGIGDPENGLVLPDGLEGGAAAIRVIMDPIDGTRGIMYDKRSAFFLAGAAPNKGAATCLRDIEVAVMVELPTSRHAVYDVLWAIKGKGARRLTCQIGGGERREVPLVPSRAGTLYGGFAQIARFFPPGREVLAAVEEEMLALLFPDAPEGRAILFEDQYISSGGQMYELMVGHDRFVADIRTLLFKMLRAQGKKTGHVCHPYDLCALLIAEEAGVVVTDVGGRPLDAPFSTTLPVDWIGYANPEIRETVEPALRQALQKHGLLLL